MSDVLRERLRTRLAEIDAAGLTRKLRAPLGIDFTSNDYLGLAQHPLVKQRMADAVMFEGAGSTGSRLLRGERNAFSCVEHKFAQFKNTPRSLYFSSGYLANVAVLTTFPEEGDVIFSDERNHASLIDGMRLSRARRVIFPHNDVQALSERMKAESGQKFLVIESLFSMDGDEAPLADYAELCRAHNAALIVDEAHAVGLYGARGSGLIEEKGIDDSTFVSINTAGKALGVSGAFVAGSQQAMEYMIQRARPFIFSTAAPPAVASAIDAALEVIANEPERRRRVLQRSAYLREQLREQLGEQLALRGGRSQIVPYVVGDNRRVMELAKALQNNGFDVRAVRPPTVAEGTARLRLTVNEGVSETAIDSLCEAIRAL